MNLTLLLIERLRYCEELAATLLAQRRQIMADDVRLRISEQLKGRQKSMETREKMRQAKLGRKLSEEHKRNISKGRRDGHARRKQEEGPK